MTSRRHNPRRAFTLVEILMVVIILGIAAAVVVPQIGTRDDLKSASAARTLMADLIYAQNRAIATQATTYVKFDATGNNYGLLSAISTPTYITHPVNHTSYRMQFGTGGTHGFEDIRLGTVDFGPDHLSILCFDELGIPYAYDSTTFNATALTAPGTVQVRCGVFTLTVSVEQDTGEITVQ